MFLIAFSITGFAKMKAENDYSIYSTSSKNLPNARISNYTISDHGNIAVVFYSKEIMIFNQKGEFVNRIVFKDTPHFSAEYKKGTDVLEVFVFRDNTALLLREDGTVIEQNKFTSDEKREEIAKSKLRRKYNGNYSYLMKSSFKFPISTCSTKLIQVRNDTGEERVIIDNKFVSIMESVGLVLVITMVCIVIYVIASRLIFAILCVVKRIL